MDTRTESPPVWRAGAYNQEFWLFRELAKVTDPKCKKWWRYEELHPDGKLKTGKPFYDALSRLD